MTDKRQRPIPPLVAAAAKRDDSALVDIYSDVRPRIERVVAFNTGDHEKAVEIAGSVLPRVLASLPNYQRSAPSATAYCMAVAWQLMRKIDKTSLPSTDYQLPAHYLDESESRVIETSTTGDPVLTAMRQLPPMWQELLQLRVLAGLRIEEAAYVLRRKPSPLRQLQARALGALAEWIDQLDTEKGTVGETDGSQ